MVRRRTISLGFAAALMAGFLAGCSDTPTSPAPPDPFGETQGLIFTAKFVTLGLGQSLQLTDFLEFHQSTPMDDFETAEWFSSDEGTVRVSAKGAVTGVWYGTAVITVRYQGKETSITVEIVADWPEDPPEPWGK